MKASEQQVLIPQEATPDTLIDLIGKTQQVRMYTVDPHRVGIQMVKWSIAEQRQRLHHAAAGAEHHIALVGDDHARSRAMLDVFDDLIGKIVHIHHGRRHAGARGAPGRRGPGTSSCSARSG